jgi:hypothetical protein
MSGGSLGMSHILQLEVLKGGEAVNRQAILRNENEQI